MTDVTRRKRDKNGRLAAEPDAKARFYEYVYPDPNSGCFIWGGGEDKEGYGLFSVNQRSVRAHRFAWEIANGSIPAGLLVLHRCDMPCCVNADHLFLGTQGDNMNDMSRKGRGVPSKQALPFGVTARRSRQRFEAHVRLSKKTVTLGTFDTIEEAAQAAAAAKHARLCGTPDAVILEQFKRPLQPTQVSKLGLPYGVVRRRGRFYAQARIDGRMRYFGGHPTVELAHQAAVKARDEYRERKGRR